MPKAFLLKRNFNSNVLDNCTLPFRLCRPEHGKEKDKSLSFGDNGDASEMDQQKNYMKKKRCNKDENPKQGKVINSSYLSEVGGHFLITRERKDFEEAKDEVINYERFASSGKVEKHFYSFPDVENRRYKEENVIEENIKLEDDSAIEWNLPGGKSIPRMKAKFLGRNPKNEVKRSEFEKKSRKKEKLDGVVYRCNQCGKIFKTRYTLSIHLKMPDHTQTRPFVCNICGKGFRLSSTLCRHKIIHTDKKPHKCPSCSKCFNRSSTLKTHMRTHSEEKSFVCHICGKGFHQKGNLRNHVMIHTGEKPFKCSKCDRAFNKMSNLKFHMHTHSGSLPYQCRKCKKRFTKKADLKDHNDEYH